MTTDLAGLARKLDKLADDLGGPGMRKALTRVGMEGKGITNRAVQADLGDMSMSNWRRGRPIQIASRFDMRSASAVEIRPNPRAAGPMRVLQDGRRAGPSKGRKRGGQVGATRGRGTWTDATDRMEKELPKVVHDHVTTVLRKNFGR